MAYSNSYQCCRFKLQVASVLEYALYKLRAVDLIALLKVRRDAAAAQRRRARKHCTTCFEQLF